MVPVHRIGHLLVYDKSQVLETVVLPMDYLFFKISD